MDEKIIFEQLQRVQAEKQNVWAAIGQNFTALNSLQAKEDMLSGMLQQQATGAAKPPAETP